MEKKHECCKECKKFTDFCECSINDDFMMRCTYVNVYVDGTSLQCKKLVEIKKLDKKNYNNNYCHKHQKDVDKINEARRLEVTRKLKDNIIELMLNESIYCHEKICIHEPYGINVEKFIKVLNSGDLDDLSPKDKEWERREIIKDVHKIIEKFDKEKLEKFIKKFDDSDFD